MGISAEAIAELHPQLFHMAQFGSWESIRRRGLLSTSALLDAFKIHGPYRAKIERTPRRTSMRVGNEGGDFAWVRDQRPMNGLKLASCLQDGLDPEGWCKILNERVFFWLTEQRLETLMAAYADGPHLILQVDTAELLKRHWKRVYLSPMNTGCTSPMAFPRGLGTFLPPQKYPFEENRKKKGGARKAIVELTVLHSVPDIADLVVRAEHMALAQGKRMSLKILFQR